MELNPNYYMLSQEQNLEVFDQFVANGLNFRQAFDLQFNEMG